MGFVIEKPSVSASLCYVTYHYVYIHYACLDDPPDGRGPNRGGNSIKTRNEKHVKLMNTGEEVFLLKTISN